MVLIGYIVQCWRPAPTARTVASRWHLIGGRRPMLREVTGGTREGTTAGQVGVEEERLTQRDLRRTGRAEPRLRHLGEWCWIDAGNLLAQRRIVARGKLGQ